MAPQESKESEFLKLYDAYANAIFRHCYFRLGERDLARELMQESFMRVWTSLATGTSVHQGRAFLYRIANNLIIDHYRKKKMTSLDLLADEGFDPPSPTHTAPSLEITIDSTMLMKVVRNHLDPQVAQVILLRYVDGFSLKEIAELTHEKENTISVRIHRGLKKIKELYNI